MFKELLTFYGSCGPPAGGRSPALTKNLSDLKNDYTYFTSHVLGSRGNGGCCSLLE